MWGGLWDLGRVVVSARSDSQRGVWNAMVVSQDLSFPMIIEVNVSRSHPKFDFRPSVLPFFKRKTPRVSSW